MRRRRLRIPGVQRLPDGRYRIRREYRDPKTGKVCEIDRRVHAADEVEALSLLERLLDERLAARGAPREPERPRLREALAKWRKGKSLTIQPSTAARYDIEIDRWTAAIGDYYVDRITPDDVREVLAGWREADLATETINGRLRTLRTFAAETQRTRMVEGVRALPREVEEDEADEDEGRGLTLEELRALIAAGPTAPVYIRRTPDDQLVRRDPPLSKPPVWWPRAWALVATMALTGLRFGEASALRWGDIDLEAGELRVRRAQWRGIVGHPKARASRRVIPIDELVPTLRAHRELMLREQLPGVASGLVFPTRRKTPTGSQFVTNTHARKTMLMACAAAGIELDGRPALHSLRHTMNNLVRQHASEEVRRSIIGHRDEVATYTHIEREEQRAAMGQVFRLIRGSSGQAGDPAGDR